MLFFKILFKDLVFPWRTRAGRQFLWLAWRWGSTPRYQPRRVPCGPYRFHVPDALSFVWQFKEIFVEEAYFFTSPYAQPVILDCGANVGTSCAYFKRLFPQAHVVAYEADPAIARYLTQNLADNHLTGVEVVAKAVWTDDVGVALGEQGADSASVRAVSPTTRVPSLRLRDELHRHPRVDLLKMDIEGAETAVLRDCADALTHVQHLFVEYHAYLGQPQDLDEILSILRQGGFRYFLRAARDRSHPLANHTYRNDAVMDLQLNLFAWRD